jgi:pyruvate dehydrogenase E1 component beta subunit
MTFNFAMQAIDHLINSAAKIRYMSAGDLDCPIVFRGINGYYRFFFFFKHIKI